ncbi:phage holin family protein [Motilibacter deserti]|uniref:Phage holin family protein n=1 Tax=Motilibacter deserti TaxID=2714956 RepID=A0ABX0H2Z7_9ACTN|nr:phage holin family protein [Motilibacter deserti]NHC16160.1 phage holin family protein [Motilibacter deserti]
MTTAYTKTGATVSTPTPPEPSLGKLVASATKDLSALVRSEIELAKIEIKSEAKHAIAGSGMFGAAAYLGLLASILLSIAAAYGLNAAGLHPALAFLIVAVVYLLIAGVLALLGKKQVSKVSAPERTIRTTKESVSTLKGAAKG